MTKDSDAAFVEDDPMPEKLLELVALELALARMKNADRSTEEALADAFEEELLIRQAELDILPVKRKAERLGIKVRFFYEYQYGGVQEPPPEIKAELERRVWQDPELLMQICEARRRLTAGTGQGQVTVKRKLVPSPIELPPGSNYSGPEFGLV
jgi:hypothetical protein